MSQRGISARDIETVLAHGRYKHKRKSIVYVVGKKEVSKLRDKVPQIADVEGIHVICASEDGTVLTAYRNHNLRLR